MTKTQIMNLAIKLSLHFPDDERIQSLMTYVLELARYDTDTDLRDRARFMTAMVGLAPSSEGDGQTKVDEAALAELAEHAKVSALLLNSHGSIEHFLTGHSLGCETAACDLVGFRCCGWHSELYNRLPQLPFRAHRIGL